MAVVLLALIVGSLSAYGWAVPTDSKFKVYNDKFVKIPIPLANTPSEQNQESPGFASECYINITGPWAAGFNATVKPLPPRIDEILKIHVDFHAFRDVWHFTARGNLTRRGAPHGYSFDVNVCDYPAAKLCPMRKGETLHIDDSVFLPSAYVDKGVYSASTELFDQDNKLLLALNVRECPIV